MKRPFHVRVDNRLLHGQVVQFWIPHLGVENLIVADDEIAENESMQTIYRLALPTLVDLKIIKVAGLKEEFDNLPMLSNMVLIRGITQLRFVMEAGAVIERVTIGNIHAAPFRTRITDAVYISKEETAALCWMVDHGVDVEIQTFPGDVLKFSKGAGGGGWSRS